jgi:hypothetical protein
MAGVEYINSLRKYLGHQPLWRVGAAVLVLNEQNQLLMIRRSESGKWGLPGGAMELGDGEHFDARCFALSNLPENVSPPIEPVLCKLLPHIHS